MSRGSSSFRILQMSKGKEKKNLSWAPDPTFYCPVIWQGKYQQLAHSVTHLFPLVVQKARNERRGPLGLLLFHSFQRQNLKIWRVGVLIVRYCSCNPIIKRTTYYSCYFYWRQTIYLPVTREKLPATETKLGWMDEWMEGRFNSSGEPVVEMQAIHFAWRYIKPGF